MDEALLIRDTTHDSLIRGSRNNDNVDEIYFPAKWLLGLFRMAVYLYAPGQFEDGQMSSLSGRYTDLWNKTVFLTLPVCETDPCGVDFKHVLNDSFMSNA